MAFIDDIRELAEKARTLKDRSMNEDVTKNALIEPFIGILGYDVSDPDEVWAEFTADAGTKKGEKVDYAILKDGSPTILFECKAAGVDLDEHTDQLIRYFGVTDARFGVLTNGITYRFFSDLEKPNVMDEKPFLELNLLDIQDPLVDELKTLVDGLKKFEKESFDVDNIVSTASKLKYTREIKRILTAEYESPSKDFVDFFNKNKKILPGRRLGSKLLEQYAGYIKDAFRQFVNAQIIERMALNETDEVAQISATDSGQSDSTQTDDKGWQPLSELNPQKGDSAPTEILFPGGDTKSIKTAWSAVLVEVARWLINNNKLNTTHCPVYVAGVRARRYLVATSPEHSTGTNFQNPENIGSFYIETNHSSEGIVQNIKYIIEYVGQDPAQFKVR